MIIVRADTRHATCTSDDAITTGSVGIPVKFMLSGQFNGLSAVAVFRSTGASVDVALMSNTCVVPHEVLRASGAPLYIGVYARNSEGTVVIPTVWTATKDIQPGTSPSGVNPSEPTPDWTAQVQLAAQEAVQTSERAITIASGAQEAAEEARQSASEAAGSATAAAGSAAAAAASEAAARAVQESIPEDYTDLSNDVSNLKSQFDDVTETLIPSEIVLDSNNIVTTWYVTGQGAIGNTGGSDTRAVYAYIAEAGEYHITKNESPKFRIGYTRSTPAAGISLYGFQNLDTATSAEISLPSDCYLVICYFVNDSRSIDKDALFNSIKVTTGNIEESAIDLVARKAIFGKKPYDANEQSFLYDVGNGYKTRGYLKLPPNYDADGKPVPLIVFVHGSGDLTKIDATTMTSTYQDYYNYLKNCGYAIFDCYAFSDKFTDAHSSYANTWGTPICDACYLSGIKYVCENWNIDKDNIFASCKSLGGLQALNMLCKPIFPIKAVGMLSPELNWLSMSIGYTTIERQFNATNLGFSEDTGGVLDWGGGSRPTGFNDYIFSNMDKWVGAFTNFSGLPIKDEDKINYVFGLENTANMCRMGLNRPLKIWIASDDNSVSYPNAVALVASLRNGGNKAELRTMPANTGKHHAVDNSPDALQTLNVTTKLGVTYASIPTAYYELGQFFDQYNTN